MSDDCENCCTCTCLSGTTIGVLLLVILLPLSLKRLDSTEYGLQYNVRKKDLNQEVFNGGLHGGPPGYRFVKFPSTFISQDLDGTCVSQDGLRVEYQVTFQYLMPQEWISPAVRKYRDYDGWVRVVVSAATSAVQHTCSEFVISNFQNQRGVIQTTMEDRLRIKLEGGSSNGTTIVPLATLPPDDGLTTTTENGTTTTTTTAATTNSSSSDDSLTNTNNNTLTTAEWNEEGVYARAISLQLRFIGLPEEYNDAVAEKQAANEDIALAISQRSQETTKAETSLQAAQQEAQRILDSANNEADVLLTEARLKAEETTFAYATEAQILVDVKKNLNLTTEGLLSYLSNDLYSKVPSLQVTALEPAPLSREDEL